jgi:immunity protein 53 of polymorphic toxin system
MSELVERLEQWYSDQCDGDWEHTWGVHIGTLDNPGWRIRIHLNETSLSGREFVPVKVDRSDLDWFQCWIKDEEFNGAGGVRNLRDILRVFLEWADKAGEGEQG